MTGSPFAPEKLQQDTASILPRSWISIQGARIWNKFDNSELLDLLVT